MAGEGHTPPFLPRADTCFYTVRARLQFCEGGAGFLTLHIILGSPLKITRWSGSLSSLLICNWELAFFCIRQCVGRLSSQENSPFPPACGIGPFCCGKRLLRLSVARHIDQSRIEPNCGNAVDRPSAIAERIPIDLRSGWIDFTSAPR